MKIKIIGDIHGRDAWKELVKDDTSSHILFLGDYVDPYKIEGIDEDDAIDNIHELIDFKIANPNRVTLLIGNHDAQYLFYPKFGTTGISKKYIREIVDIFYSNRNLFQMAFQVKDYLFIHAGVTNGWFKECKKALEDAGLKPDLSNLADTFNKLIKTQKGLNIFDMVSFYRNGINFYGSPIWADDRELFKGHLSGMHQIVGHNKHTRINRIGDKNSSVTFCDCLWSEKKSLTLSL